MPPPFATPTCGEFESQFKLILTNNSIHHAGHCKVDEEFIATETLPKIRADSKLTPKAIEDHFKDVYGVEIGYYTARRRKEHALKVINGLHEEAYNSLPKYR